MTQLNVAEARELLKNCQALCTRIAAFGPDLDFTQEEETALLGFKRVADANLVRATHEDAGLSLPDAQNLWRAYKAYLRQQAKIATNAKPKDLSKDFRTYDRLNPSPIHRLGR